MLSATINILESSAKSRILPFLVAAEMSLIYIKNNSGPNTVPCGTPQTELEIAE